MFHGLKKRSIFRRSRAPSFSDQLRENMSPGPDYEPDTADSSAPIDPLVKLIAFYLPQFHPIPENDLWWGKGFTEWTNVSKALPQFPGHHQPQLPGELGFYDLRVEDILRRQAALARKYGIHGFCFHYYWFGGKRLLEAPLNLLLARKDVDFPFCICWANENWTRRWDGFEQEVLIAQNHSPEDDIAFARSLEPLMRDRRYITINGRPLIIVYRPGLLPDAMATARRWRLHFVRAGFPDPYLVMAQGFGDEDPRAFDFDAAMEFPPHKLGSNAQAINKKIDFFDPSYQGTIFDYEDLSRNAAAVARPDFPLFRNVCAGWDNEARKPGRGTVYAFSTPKKYATWLANSCHYALEASSPDERLVFVNAWNEWAEGAHLEPDRHFGYAYLRQTAEVLRSLDVPGPRAAAAPGIVVVSHDAHFHGAQTLALHLVEALVRDFGLRVHVLLGGPGRLEERFRAVAPTELVENGFGKPASWLAVGKRLRNEGFSFAVCNTLVSAQAIKPLAAAGLRVISLVHELPSLIRQFGLLDAARTAARQAEAVVFASKYGRDQFVKFAGPVKRREIIRPQGVYPRPAPADELADQRRRGRAQLGADSADKIVLGIGFGDLRKGLDLWPALIRGVLVNCPTALFVWIGRIDSSLETWVRHDLEITGQADRLRLLGEIDDLRLYYAAADAFLLTSREDPFPRVVTEALAHGVPVVAFEGSGGIVDLVRESGGTLAPYLDLDAMAASVGRLLCDESERARLGAIGRERMAKDFAFADYAFDIVRLAEERIRKISVIVPNYNYGPYLRQRLKSIWAQTYPIYELIVLDDASSDNSTAILGDLQRTSGRRFSVVRNAVNSGSVSRQWARGVEAARGDFIWIAEADDFAEPDFLAAMVKAFDEPGVVMSYCQSRQIDGAGRVLADTYLDYVADVDTKLWQSDYRRSGLLEIGEALSVKNTIPNVSAVLFRRDRLAEVLSLHLGEMVGYRNAADWYCYIRLLCGEGDIAYTAASLNSHRRHTRSLTLATADRRHLDEIIAMQHLAASVAAVRPERSLLARLYAKAVADHFGLSADEPEEYSPSSAVI
jgi:O-antigen biosynthesis protein